VLTELDRVRITRAAQPQKENTMFTKLESTDGITRIALLERRIA